MRAKMQLRISSIILFLFALGHTVGFLTFRPAAPQALEVMEAMRQVPFAFGSATVHWMDLYTGFGLAVSVSGFFSAIVAWRVCPPHIAQTPAGPKVAWPLFATRNASNGFHIPRLRL